MVAAYSRAELRRAGLDMGRSRRGARAGVSLFEPRLLAKALVFDGALALREDEVTATARYAMKDSDLDARALGATLGHLAVELFSKPPAAIMPSVTQRVDAFCDMLTRSYEKRTGTVVPPPPSGGDSAHAAAEEASVGGRRGVGRDRLSREFFGRLFSHYCMRQVRARRQGADDGASAWAVAAEERAARSSEEEDAVARMLEVVEAAAVQVVGRLVERRRLLAPRLVAAVALDRRDHAVQV